MGPLTRDWLESQPALVSSVVYTYLSLLPGHMSPSLANLREQEAQLCVSLIRNRVRELGTHYSHLSLPPIPLSSSLPPSLTMWRK